MHGGFANASPQNKLRRVFAWQSFTEFNAGSWFCGRQIVAIHEFGRHQLHEFVTRFTGIQAFRKERLGRGRSIPLIA